VSSVGIIEERPVNPFKLHQWITDLLLDKGADMFRMKGMLHLADNANRFVFQGVHMLFDGQADRPWRADEPRLSQMVFIGRHLDRTDTDRRFRDPASIDSEHDASGSTSAARIRWAVELADGVQDLAWSPDGRWLAAAAVSGPVDLIARKPGLFTGSGRDTPKER
jgi:hypothetical protein